VSARGFLNF